jgi:hypothetical protein
VRHPNLKVLDYIIGITMKYIHNRCCSHPAATSTLPLHRSPRRARIVLNPEPVLDVENHERPLLIEEKVGTGGDWRVET